MNVLITGATGLIGYQLTKKLLHEKSFGEVAIFVRNKEKATSLYRDDINKLIVLTGDIRDPLEPCPKVDYIFHCASVTSSKMMIENPQETMSVIVDGTMNVLEFAKRQHIKGMVYLSSMEVYGVVSEEDNPATEETEGYVDLNSPRSSYPQAKRIAEKLCKDYAAKYGLNIKIARLAQTFGDNPSNNDNRVFMQFARCVANSENIVLHTKGKSMCNFCYLDDTLDALTVIMDKGILGEAYNVCNDKETRTILEIANMVANDIAEGRIKVVFDIPKENSFGYASDTALKMNSDKLHTLGWTPKVSMEEAYRRLIENL